MNGWCAIVESSNERVWRQFASRYEELRDPDSQSKLPVITVSNFSSGVAGKEVVVLVAGEHARELITTEIALWFGRLLVGEETEELHDWGPLQSIQATAWKSGWTQGTLREWASQLLERVTFKANRSPWTQIITHATNM